MSSRARINVTQLDSLTAWETQYNRTVASKLGDVVSVKDYGVVGDGATDDFLALQAAFSDASLHGKTLLFPTGCWCKVSFTTQNANLFLYGNASIIGAGARSCGFKITKNYNHTGHAPLFCFGIPSKGAAVNAWTGAMDNLGFELIAGCSSFERLCHFYEWQNARVTNNWYDGRAVTWPVAGFSGGFLSSNIQATWATGQTDAYGIVVDNNEMHASANYQNNEAWGFTNLHDSIITRNRSYGFSDDCAIHGGSNIIVEGNTHSTVLGRFYGEDCQNVTWSKNYLTRCKLPDGTWQDGSGGTAGFRVSMTGTYAVNNSLPANSNIRLLNNTVVIPSGAWLGVGFYVENVQNGLIIDGNFVDNAGSADTTTNMLSVVQSTLMGSWTGPVGNPDYSNGGVVRLRNTKISNNHCVGSGWADGEGSLGISAAAGAPGILGPIDVTNNTVGGIYAPYSTINVAASNRTIPATVAPYKNVSVLSLSKVAPSFSGIVVSGDNFNATSHPIGTPLTIKDRGGLDYFPLENGSIRGVHLNLAAAAVGPNFVFARIMKTTGGTRAQLGSDVAFSSISPTTNAVIYRANFFGVDMSYLAGDKIELLLYNAAGQTVTLTGTVYMYTLSV